LKKYRNAKYFINMTSELGGYFNFKMPVTQEFVAYMIDLFLDTPGVNNVGIFLQKAVQYYPEFNQAVRNLLYNTQTDLLDFYYGHLFVVFDKNIPLSFKQKILLAINRLQDKTPLSARDKRVEAYRTQYLEQFLDVERKFIKESIIPEKLVSYLVNFPTIKEQLRELDTYIHEMEYYKSITEYIQSNFQSKTIRNKDRQRIYSFLFQRNLSRISGIYELLKIQLWDDIYFPSDYLHELTFSQDELNKLLEHPTMKVRLFAGKQLGIEKTKIMELIKEFQIFTVIKIIYFLNGIPNHLWGLKEDLRILKKIQSFDEARYKIILPQRRVIKIALEEYLQLPISFDYLHYMAEVENKNLEQEAEYFLLFDYDNADLTVEAQIELNEKMKDVLTPINKVFEPPRG
ncbi:MAG: hypothetical protein ACFFD1_02715, partial [Candidatus Thorarchaeota archaeon]